MTFTCGMTVQSHPGTYIAGTKGRIEIDAFWFGHGTVAPGPHLVEYMPIGSHHTWFGLLFGVDWAPWPVEISLLAAGCALAAAVATVAVPANDAEMGPSLTDT